MFAIQYGDHWHLPIKPDKIWTFHPMKWNIFRTYDKAAHPKIGVSISINIFYSEKRFQTRPNASNWLEKRWFHHGWIMHLRALFDKYRSAKFLFSQGRIGPGPMDRRASTPLAETHYQASCVGSQEYLELFHAWGDRSWNHQPKEFSYFLSWFYSGFHWGFLYIFCHFCLRYLTGYRFERTGKHYLELYHK